MFRVGTCTRFVRTEQSSKKHSKGIMSLEHNEHKIFSSVIYSHFTLFNDIPVFNVKYLTKYKVQRHAGAVSNSASIWAIIHSLKLLDYLPIQTYKAYILLIAIFLLSKNVQESDHRVR